ncbi:Hypothetical protein PHPALM_10733 [Phytophthora palmivora]|uniref:Uncharacterized protein n=1 Tax=Phytophthora palmivora TaxID=4796 RepID=A0A2P4Y3Z6_9STRA|nr:Hypothetical protein PHPALM_10733 [Phytophthora palmivora]
MHHKQKQHEDKKIDISTQVKRTKKTIENLSKQNDLRSKDAEVKQREQDYMTLQQMKQWYAILFRICCGSPLILYFMFAPRYDHVWNIQKSLSGLEIAKVADDYIEVRVLKSHSVRLFCDPETTRLQRVQVSGYTCCGCWHFTYIQFLQFLTPDVIAADLVEVAVGDNNVHYLLCEYRERVREQLAP